MTNQKTNIEEKIVLFIDSELDKVQRREVKELLKYCSESKKLYLQYLNIKKETSLFYKTVDTGTLKLKFGSNKSEVKYKYRYAIIAILFLFTSIGIILLNTKQSEKINSNILIQEDQIDLHINEISREIDYLDDKLSQETL